jgi:hypothetical protein
MHEYTYMVCGGIILCPGVKRKPMWPIKSARMGAFIYFEEIFKKYIYIIFLAHSA